MKVGGVDLGRHEQIEVAVGLEIDQDRHTFAPHIDIGEASGTINFYRNNGTKQAPLFELESDEYADIDIGRRSSPTLTDIDHDGDLDLLIGTDAGPIEVFRNRGTAAIADFVGEGPLPIDVPPLTVPVFADMDGDGDLDLLVGNTGGGVIYFRNLADGR